MLIQLTPGEVVSDSIVERARRNGNYTDVWIKGEAIGFFRQIWDDDKKVWNRLELAAQEVRDG